MSSRKLVHAHNQTQDFSVLAWLLFLVIYQHEIWGSIFNIQSWICLLGHACTEQTTVKYHTSLLVFCHRGETPPPPPKRVNPSDLPHVVIELFPISCFFLVGFSDLKPEML